LCSHTIKILKQDPIINSALLNLLYFKLLTTSAIFSILHPLDLEVINSSAVKIGLTTRSETSEAIYLCAYFQLRTLKLYVGSIFGNKTCLTSLNENMLVNDQLW
jgi:hypothetical protein